VDVGPAELIIVLLVVLVLFGGAKLPKLARSLGEAQTEFKKGRREGFRFDDPDETEAEAETKAAEDPAPVAGDPATGETATADGPDAEAGTETTDPPETPPA
jgi:sec-independent protein translocase protein TatA